MSAQRGEEGRIVTGSGPTIFELVRRIDEIATRVDDRDDKIAERFERLAERLEAVALRYEERVEALALRTEERYVPRDTHAALVDRVRKIEDRSEWLVRIVGALVIAAVLGLVLVTGQGSGS